MRLELRSSPIPFVNPTATATNQNFRRQAARAAIANRFQHGHLAGPRQVGRLREGHAFIFRKRRRFAVLSLALHSLLMLCFGDWHPSTLPRWCHEHNKKEVAFVAFVAFEWRLSGVIAATQVISLG